MISSEELNERQKKLFQALQFLAKLLVAGMVFRTIIWIYPDTSSIQSLTAEIVHLPLSLTFSEVSRDGFIVLIQDTRYVITQDCLGWKSVAAFISLVYASSKDLRNHLRYIFAGASLIIVANLVRIYTTIILAEKGVISFDIIHDFLWSWSLTILVILAWIYWMRRSDVTPG